MPDSFNQLDRYIQKLLEIQDSLEAAQLNTKSLKEIAADLGLSEADWATVQNVCVQHIKRAKGYTKHKNWLDAIHEYEQAKAIRPNDLDILYGLAHTHTQQWKATKSNQHKILAQKYAVKSLQIDPTHDPSFRLINQLKQKHWLTQQQFYVGSGLGLMLLLIAYFSFIRISIPIEQTKKPPTSPTLKSPQFQYKSQTVVLEQGSVTVDFKQNRLSKDIQLQLGDLNFSGYQNAFSLKTNGYLIPTSIEIYDLKLNFKLYNGKNQLIGEVTKKVWSKNVQPTARSGDKIPFYISSYADYKFPPPLTRLEISLLSIDKAIAPNAYETADSVAISWEPKRPKNINVMVLARKNNQSFSERTGRLTQKNTFEFINVGNAPIRSMKGRIDWIKKDGTTVAAREAILLYNFHPTLQRGEMRIVNFSGYGDDILKSELDHYKVVITNVDY